MMPLVSRFALAGAAIVLAGCTDEPTAANSPVDPSTVLLVRELAAQRGIEPLDMPPRVRWPLVRLGRLLAFDPILSGNRDVSCATCHLPALGTGDGKSLSVGEGGDGLGPSRSHPAGVFIPRNAPPMYNLGAMKRLFWDGRVEEDAQGRIHTPAGDQITPAMAGVFEFGAISALSMFPVANRLEMRGMSGNELAAIPDDSMSLIWEALMRRLGEIPGYRMMFTTAYPGIPFDSMTFAHASNAIAGFLVDQLTLPDTPWDRFLAGDDRALTPRQLEGARTFLTLKCPACHGGPTLSDQEFHNVAVAQIGPGQGTGALLRDDFGRADVTGNPEDRYRFRTMPLRNVELTGPYGHDGAFLTLRSVIEHYSESDMKLRTYDPAGLEPDLRGTLLSNADEILTTRDTIIDGVVLTDEMVDKLLDYMTALTSESARSLSRLTPPHVPSGLPVAFVP